MSFSRPTSSSSTSSSSPQVQSKFSSPMSHCTTLHPMASTTSFQTTSTAFTFTPGPSSSSDDGKKRSSFFKSFRSNAPSTSDLPLLSSQRPETKQEKKERKRREQEAKMSPEELRLAQLMGRYGSGGSFGGMSMDYKTKDQQRR